MPIEDHAPRLETLIPPPVELAVRADPTLAALITRWQAAHQAAQEATAVWRTPQPVLGPDGDVDALTAATVAWMEGRPARWARADAAAAGANRLRRLLLNRARSPECRSLVDAEVRAAAARGLEGLAGVKGGQLLDLDTVGELVAAADVAHRRDWQPVASMLRWVDELRRHGDIGGAAAGWHALGRWHRDPTFDARRREIFGDPPLVAEPAGPVTVRRPPTAVRGLGDTHVTGDRFPPRR